MSPIAFADPTQLVSLKIPFYTSLVPAGFPSPADDHLEASIDLNTYLVDKPSATFFVRVEGDSMIGNGIFPGDMVIVDRSLRAQDGDVILAVLEGEFTIKTLRKIGKRVFLESSNPSYPPITLNEDSDFGVWGVVTYVVHKP